MKTFSRETRQRIRVVIIIVLILLLGLSGAVGWSWYRGATAGRIAMTAAPAPGETVLGTPLSLRYTFTVPWGQTLENPELQTAQGWVSVEVPEVQTVKRHWGSTEEAVTLTLRAFRTGAVSPGTLTVPFQQPHCPAADRQAPKTLPLPVFTVNAAPVDPQAELPLADALIVQPPPRRWPWIAGGIVILVILGAMWAFRHRRRDLPPPPEAWEIAARDLAALRCSAASGGHSAAWCFARLTDVVRDYLTRRFQLRADRQTTEEFLRSLARGNSPLGPEEEHTLANFLQQADLIKFAGILPERDAFGRAIDHAEQLVRDTTPEPAAPRSAKEDPSC